MPRKLEITAPPIEIGTKFQVGQRADVEVAALPERAGALPEPLQVIARQYIGARRRNGETLLVMARWLSEAKQIAVHGEWGIFLAATGTSDDTAERLLNIHSRAMEDSRFADAIARDWLSQSAAALLARPSTPPELIADVLNESEHPDSEPPTKASIAARLPTSKPAQNPHSADFDEDSRTVERGGTTYQQKPKQRNLGPGQPPPEPWPDAPDGWRWNRRGAPAHLIAPDGWRTKDYDYPERALAEAQRRILSTPKAERAHVDLPIEYAVIQRRYAVHGIELLSNMQGHARAFVTRKEGGTGIVTFDWQDILNRLSLLEDGMDLDPQEQPKIPEVAPDPDDLASVQWRWKVFGYQLLRDLARPITENRYRLLPPDGQVGIVNLGWSEVLDRLEALEQQPKIPEVAAPAVVERAICSIDGCDRAGVGTHQIGNQGAAHWFCDQHAPIIAALNSLPRKSVSADSSAILAYLEQLETRTAQLVTAVRALLNLT